MSFWTVCTPTVLPSAMAIFSACSVLAAVPDTFTLSPSTSILTFDESRPCLSSSFLSSSAGAALASLPPKIDAPAFLMKLISPMNWLPIAAGTRPSLSEAPPRHRVRTYPRTRRRGQGARLAAERSSAFHAVHDQADGSETIFRSDPCSSPLAFCRVHAHVAGTLVPEDRVAQAMNDLFGAQSLGQRQAGR